MFAVSERKSAVACDMPSSCSASSSSKWTGPLSDCCTPDYLTGESAYDHGWDAAEFATDSITIACYREVETIHACGAMPSNSSLVHAQSLLAIQRYHVVWMAAIANGHEDGVP